MATVFCGLSVLIILFNLPLVPDFFVLVLGGAFAPDALFGGSIGIGCCPGGAGRWYCCW